MMVFFEGTLERHRTQNEKNYGEADLRLLVTKRDRAWLTLISIINIGANAVEIDPRYADPPDDTRQEG